MTVRPINLAFLVAFAFAAGGLVATPTFAEQRQTTGTETGNTDQTANPDSADDSDNSSKADTPDHTAGAAPATDEGTVYGTSYDLILKALEDNGFKGQLTEDDDGDPRIKSTDEDEPFSIHFYGCDDNHENCTYIQFTSGWDLKNGISFAKIEDWNREKVWGQAWVDDKKDPWVAITVNLDGGVSYDNFKDTVDWWRIVLRDFEEHIGWNKE